MNRYPAALVSTFVSLHLMVLGGCVSSVTQVSPETIVSAIDFTPYTQRGFLFTPEVYEGPYEAIGLITVTRYAAGHYATDMARWEFDPIPVRDVLDSVYARAMAMGGDALMRFRLENVVAPAAVRLPATPGLEVSGFAIRRRK